MMINNCNFNIKAEHNKSQSLDRAVTLSSEENCVCSTTAMFTGSSKTGKGGVSTNSCNYSKGLI